MFENCSIMIIKENCGQNQICRLDLDAKTQKAICEGFESAQKDLIRDKTRIVFDGSYKPHSDEFLAIENFKLPDEILDAIRDPIGVNAYQKEDNTFPEIKAIFVGECIQNGELEKFNIAFQRFRKEQYISTKWYNLFFDNNTFSLEKRFGISISDSIDCYYTDGDLEFVSFYFARQVFDLASYYRSATEQEVDLFIDNPKLLMKNSESFKGMADSWIRRKIAMINDSGFLENYSAEEIKEQATNVGLEVNISDKKIEIPNDKEKVKIILGFLDEEAYKGPFSQKTYLANSKRQIK